MANIKPLQPLDNEQRSLAEKHYLLYLDFLSRHLKQHKDKWYYDELCTFVKFEYIYGCRNFNETNGAKISTYLTSCMSKGIPKFFGSKDYSEEKFVSYEDTYVGSRKIGGGAIYVDPVEELMRRERSTHIELRWNTREKKIADMLREGLTMAEIGRKMGVCRERVRQYVSEMGRKARCQVQAKLCAEI